MSEEVSVWCIRSRRRRDGSAGDRLCALASQPKGEPRYRDNVKVRCGLSVTCPGRFEWGVPDCSWCKEGSEMSDESEKFEEVVECARLAGTLPEPEVSREEIQKRLLAENRCMGGCGRPAPQGHEMCHDCLEGANILNRKALDRKNKQIEQLQAELAAWESDDDE